MSDVRRPAASSGPEAPSLRPAPPRPGVRSSRGRRAALSAAVLSGLVLAGPSPALGGPPEADPVAAAQALFREASAKLDARDFEHACPMLERVLALEPGANGARLALAECYEGAGRLASAHATYAAVAETAARLGQTERASAAKERAGALVPRLGGVIVQLAAGARAVSDLAITIDGEPLPASALDRLAPLDGGSHEIAATAPGKSRWTRAVEVRDGVTITVTIDALADSDPPVPAPPSAPAAPPSAGVPGAQGALAASRPGAQGALAASRPGAQGAPAGRPVEPRSLSHRGQPGAFVRLDYDALSGGAVTALGLSYAPHGNLELGASGLVGKRAGFEIGVTGFLLTGPLKPLIRGAVPVLFQGDAYAGVKGAAGLLWDVNRHLGVEASIGAAYFPEVPAGYTHAALLLALGVQARL